MITSGANQYLRPEYLTPLPTTLDAKKSPLALLAQTCSQIGADSSSTKLIPSIDKHSKKSSDSTRDREKVSPASSVGSNISAGDNIPVKSSFKPYETSIKDNLSEERVSAGSRARTPLSKSSSNTPAPVNGNRCHSNHSSSSPRSSPASATRKTPSNNDSNIVVTSSSSKTSTTQSTAVPRSVPSPPSKIGFSPSLLTSSSDPLLKDLPLGTFKPGAGLPIPTGLLSGYPPPGGAFPLDMMASSFLSPHALKAGLNPYLNYARLKTASGNDTIVPVCRDPYCTGCQLNSHMLSGGKPNGCPGGCTQCDHKPTGFLPTSAGSAAAAAYAHAQLAALAAASQLPYVCNWIAGDAAYCGKRFSNSEELLQHLKTHTNISNTETSSNSSSPSAMSMLSPPGLPPTLPLLHRTYPTPPLSPLATARYHPYSKTLLPPSFSSLTFPLHPHPSLAPYLSPYSLYGPRLGASSMHP